MIEFSHVSMRYPNGFEALKDINLTIPDGSFVAIIGRSGAGKSTLIRTINKLYDTSEGSITVDGTKVEGLRGASLRRFRRKVGMIFQSFNLITRVRAFASAVVPQVLPGYLSNCLFCFEGNVRYASILGYVGAGGLGLVLNEKIGWRMFPQVGMVLVALFVTVFVIESVSRAARRHLA